jgi:hypothetical protein
MMNVVWQSYGRNHPDSETIRYWFDKLVKHEFNVASNAFDEWLKTQKDLPTVSDILKLCQHKVTIHARIASPLALESYKQHADNVIAYVAKNIKPQSDYRAWIKPILANPKNYPDISLQYAKEVAGMKA